MDVIESILDTSGERAWRVRGVVDDSPSAENLERLEARGIEYLGRQELELERSPGAVAIAIGSPATRARVAARWNSAGWVAPAFVHPLAHIGSACHVAEGAIVCAGAQLSTNVRLGRHVHVNPNATIGHDTELGAFSSINPGAVVSGDVRIGDGVLIGAGAVVLQGIVVGEGSIVGAAACVTRDVRAGVTVKGIPAV